MIYTMATRRAPVSAGRSRRRDAWELGIGYGLILAVLWTPRPYQRALYLVAALFLFVVTALAFRGWGAMGVRLTNLGRSAWVVGVAALLAAGTIVAATRLHTLHAPGGLGALLHRYWGYALWAFVQQILLQDFFLRRLLHLMPGRRAAAALAAAGIFAFAHLPNPVLATVTLVWGAAACSLFLRYRNIIPLALAHAIFGIMLSVSLPQAVIRGMHVGLGYFTYRAGHPHPHPLPGQRAQGALRRRGK